MADIAMVVPLVARIVRKAALRSSESATKLSLFGSAFTVDELTTLADLNPIELVCDGYTAGGFALTWTTGYITADFIPSDESNLVSIVMPNPVVVGGTVFGGWVHDVGGLLMAFNLISPVALTSPGQALKLMLEDSYPPGVPSVQVIP